MKRILDKSFVYVPSDRTDVRATFERIRKELESQAERKREEAAWRLRNVIEAKKAQR